MKLTSEVLKKLIRETIRESSMILSEGLGRDASELLRKGKAAIYVYENPDERCPAKWKEGEETLIPTLDLSGKI